MKQPEEEVKIKKQVELQIKYVKKQIEEIDKSTITKKEKSILLLCFLDSYAQINCSQGSNKKKFEYFLIEFATEYNFWEEIGFINLSYKFNEEVKNEFQKSIKRILGSTVLTIDKQKENMKIQKIIDNMKKEKVRENGDQLKASEEIEKYKYINLLYKYRSKLVHEYVMPSPFNDMVNEQLPHYISGISDQRLSNKEISGWNNVDITKLRKKRVEVIDYYFLVFPYDFIKELTQISIINYYEKCLKDKRYPFENHIDYLHWYE